MDVKRYELRWRHHQSTVVAEVGSLYRDAALVDVTLACEDQRTYQAHKLVLSACSQYFQGLFARHQAHQHPIIFLKDVSGEECEALLTYMYLGEVSVRHDQIENIIRVANSLQVRGLGEMETSSSRPPSPSGERTGHCPSSSPSPSTGPPTKCVTPLSEPHSPNPPPPLINPPLSTVGSSSSSSHHCHTSQSEPNTRHPGPISAPSPVVTSGPIKSFHPPHLPPDYPYLLQSHRSNFDLPVGPPASALLPGISDPDRKRPEDSKSGIIPFSTTATPQLRVKQDLGSNWENPTAVDVGLPMADPVRPFMPQHVLLTSLLHEQQAQAAMANSPVYQQRGFPISDPLRRLDRLGSSGGETRIHKCDYCSRKFKRKDHLKTHVRIHTGERPYKCKICGRGFIQSQQVKIHMKVHVREDSSGLGAASGLGGGGSSTLSALYSDMSHYSNPTNLSAAISHSSLTHTDIDVHGQDLSSQPMDADSDNDCSSEVPEIDFEIKEEGRSRTPSAASSSAPPPYSHAGEHKTPSPPSPQSMIAGVGGSSGSGGSLARPLSSPADEQSCSAMSMKESFHIGSNLKK